MGNSQNVQATNTRRQSKADYQTMPNVPDDPVVESSSAADNVAAFSADDGDNRGEGARRGLATKKVAKIRVLVKGNVFVTFDNNAAGNDWGYHSERNRPHITEIYEVMSDEGMVEIYGAVSPDLKTKWILTVFETGDGVPSNPRFTFDDDGGGRRVKVVVHTKFIREDDRSGRTALSFKTKNAPGIYYLVPGDNQIEVQDEEASKERHYFRITSVDDNDGSTLRPEAPVTSDNDNEVENEEEEEEEEECEEKEGEDVNVIESQKEDVEQFVK